MKNFTLVAYRSIFTINNFIILNILACENEQITSTDGETEFYIIVLLDVLRYA
jgi:hypothetical protein